MQLRVLIIAVMGFVATGAALAPGFAQTAGQASPAPLWQVDADNSRITFTGVQSGETFDGEFAAFDAVIRFDDDNLAGSSINVAIDAASAKTGERQRDDALPGSDWFHVKSFPKAHFSSTSIRKTGKDAYEAAGALSIRNVKKDVVLPFTLMIDGDKAEAVGGLSLIRTDYGVGQGAFATGQWVDLEVSVSVRISATRL